MSARFLALRDWPLRIKAPALLLLSSVIPVLLATGLMLERERTTVWNAKEAVLQARVDEVGHSIEAMHRTYQTLVTRAANDWEVAQFCSDRSPELREHVERDLAVLRDSDPAVRGVGVAGLDGTILLATEREIVGADIAYRDYFKRALAGAEPTPDVHVSVPATVRVPTMAYAAPVRSRDGQVIGAYVLWVRAQALWDALRAANGMAGPGSFFVLFDRDGIRIGHSANEKMVFHPAQPLAADASRTMLASRRFQERTAELLAAVVPFPLDEIRDHERKLFRRFSPTNSQWNLAVSRRFPELGWTLVTLIPESAVEVTLGSLLPRVVPPALIGLALALAGGALVMRWVVRPIRALSAGAAALERGNFTLADGSWADLESLGKDEIGVLAEAFGSMAATLADRDRLLSERNRDLRQVLDSVGQGFVSMDSTGIMSPERSAIVDRWFGAPRPGEPIWSYLGREDEHFADRLRCAWGPLFRGILPLAVIAAETPRLERGGRTFDLDYRLVEVQGRTERVILIISDITAEVEQEKSEHLLQLELQQAQKLEAVGRLAAGIAHEINTPIQYIGDNTHFMGEAFAGLSELLRLQREALGGAAVAPQVRERLESAAASSDLDYLVEEAPRAVARTLEGVKRVATIVRAMKEFAHPDQKGMVAIDLNRALLATLEIARNEYKYVAEVESELGDIPPVTCHPGDLNQVFLNIIVNAAHAIADVVKGTPSRGTIRVATRREDGDVIVAISDTGGGIPEEIRDKIFEQFFTTKEVGRGTGQGLAIARAVIRQHKGSLTFTSSKGEGTTFTVRVPIEPGTTESPRAAPAA